MQLATDSKLSPLTEVAYYTLDPNVRIRVLRDYYTPPSVFILSLEVFETWRNTRGETMQLWEIDNEIVLNVDPDSAGHHPVPSLNACLEAFDLDFDAEPDGDH